MILYSTLHWLNQPEFESIGGHQELWKVHRPAGVVIKDAEESAPLVLVGASLVLTMRQELLSAVKWCNSAPNM